MIIRTNDKELQVKTVISDIMKKGTKTYPALRFEFENEATAEDLQALVSGNFEILDDSGNVMGTYEGYTTLKNISVTIGKIAPTEQQIEELKTALAASQAENAELQEALNVVVGGNAK